MSRSLSFKRKHNKPVFWVVLSPTYTDGGYDWYDPPEETRDVLFVRALSARKAKILAIRAWRRGWNKGLLRRRKVIVNRKPYIVQDSYINPMAALTVHRCLLTGENVDTRVL